MTGTFSLSSAVVGLETSLSRCCEGRASEGSDNALVALVTVEEADDDAPHTRRIFGSAGWADART